MKRVSAIAVIDFSEIPAGVFATDAMLKKSPIGFVKSGSTTRGRYLTLVGGSPASVQEALAEAMRCGGDAILDRVMLADVHPELLDGMLGKHATIAHGSLAIVETDTVSASVRAAEAALKGATVQLVEIRLADAGLAGKGLFVVQGELHDIEAAVDLAIASIEGSGRTLSSRIISAPHEGLVRALEGTTTFSSTELLDLDGEVG